MGSAESPAQTDLPEGFVLDAPPVPEGFVLDEPHQRTAGQETARQVGLKVRALGQGTIDTFNVAAEPLRVVMNKALELAGVDYQFPEQSQAFSQALTEVGLPEPENAGERISNQATEFIAPGGAFIKGGRYLADAADEVTRRVGQSIASNPTQQLAAATLAGGSSQAVEEAGGGPLAQATTGLAASFVPSATTAATQATARRVFRGGEAGRQTVEENVETFGRAGTTPSVGQATELRRNQAGESILNKVPGGAGPTSAAAKRQAEELGAAADDLSNRIAPKSTAERAGQQVEQGIKGPGGFVSRFMDKAGKLYDDVDQYLDTSQAIPLNSTKRFLGTPSDLAAGAPNTAKVLTSKYLDDLGVAIDKDIAAQLDASGVDGLSYAAVRAIRSEVGKKISNLTLVTDVSKGQLKQLYGALTDDLTNAAKQAGPEAAKAANRANAYYRAGRNRIDEIERVVNKHGGPEKVFNAVMSGTKDGATTLRTIMKSLKPEEKDFLTAAVIRRMGRATPGQQDASGEAFSINTYLTNWAKLSPEARGALFGRLGPEFRKDVDALAKVAENLRDGSDVFRNPSGTAPAATAITTGVGGVTAAVTGNFPALAAILGGVAGANLTARLMVNPRFVKFLARSTRLPEGAKAAQLNALAQFADQDEDIAELMALVEQSQNDQANQGGGNQ